MLSFVCLNIHNGQAVHVTMSFLLLRIHNFHGQFLLSFIVESFTSGLRASVPFVLILILEQEGVCPVAAIIHYCSCISLQYIFQQA